MDTLRTKLNHTEAGFDIYNSEKAYISEKANITGGGELRHNILVGPSISYYLQVRDYYASASGQYLVKVSPLKSYDRFEPNDSILNPTVMEIDSSLQAHIMDGGDQDFYSFTANQAGNLVVNIENQSTSLRPRIDIFNQQKSHIFEHANTTAGGNIRTIIKLEAGKKYFLKVIDYYKSRYGE